MHLNPRRVWNPSRVVGKKKLHPKNLKIRSENVSDFATFLLELYKNYMLQQELQQESLYTEELKIIQKKTAPKYRNFPHKLFYFLKTAHRKIF